MSGQDVGWTIIGVLFIAGLVMLFSSAAYYIHDNSIKNIPYHTALVEHCSPPANWNAPICTSQNRP